MHAPPLGKTPDFAAKSPQKRRGERRPPVAHPLLKWRAKAEVGQSHITLNEDSKENFMNTLTDLFLDSLADMYYAETQLVKALPKMAKAATHDDLREAIELHLTETEGHVQKLEEVFEQFGEKPRTKKCPAIVGIIKEAEEIVSENRKSPTINAAIIYAAQKAEHYEIASYGTLREWARHLQKEEAAELIDDILDQEKAADEKLTELAEGHCNESAATEAAETAA
jgi:ferritin-like metal-binding protein YciE